ncbi:MAG: hypothetical protein EP338_10635 [Bacteroidetes bacterium]|nr:MAG: hypothetical protein EP338_10635 [Bacteroidota bacterium]
MTLGKALVMFAGTILFVSCATSEEVVVKEKEGTEKVVDANGAEKEKKPYTMTKTLDGKTIKAPVKSQKISKKPVTMKKVTKEEKTELK